MFNLNSQKRTGLSSIMQYLVTANTYDGGYGLELTLFGIFPTREAATKWILEHPMVEWSNGKDHYGQPCLYSFNFLQYYDKYAVKKIYEEDASGRMTCVGQRTQSKEEYVQQYIAEFNGNPILLDCYVE